MIEDNIVELEKLVTALEDDGVSIEAGIGYFEKGLALTKVCLETLAENKGKITMLKQQMDKLFEEDSCE